ncbi:fumarylacetoacetate hydrolase family protein [Gynurincola endophyticus]|jgi:2,4-diketo-3-deoxy-L-fuconate hydrolase|uniref:fumarylacetoacetate hydrolase family protein n=1 Tax=Gynurincola endophyticus TaxID=2479004 RepID=UPI000F8E98C2|nr:fumarylacetoacetate hydrolase family protein [Gynurincola endophyticus]
MKLIRFGNLNKEKPGLLIDNIRYDVSEWVNDYDERFFEENGLERLKNLATKKDALPLVADDSRWGAPVARPSKIVCIGLNFYDHARETNMTPPTEPIIFFKASSAYVGPNDPLVIPRNSQKTDWEVELAVIIGKKASYVEEKNALEYVAGYCLHNDYSERAFQLERNGQWVKGKSCDSFAPIGPFLATQDEIADIHNLNMWLKVNGETKQNGTTAEMIFNVPYLISYVSQFMTLLPGDIISTGTPAGVGMGMKPTPQYLKAGDVIELGIEGLGSSQQIAQNAL